MAAQYPYRQSQPPRHHQSRDYYRADHSTPYYDPSRTRKTSLPGTPGYHERSAPINMLSPEYPAAIARDYLHHQRPVQDQGDLLNKELERALRAQKRAQQIRRGTVYAKHTPPKTPNPIYGPKPESDKPRHSHQPYVISSSSGQGFNGKRSRRVSFSTPESPKEPAPSRGHDHHSSRGYHDHYTSGRKENYRPDAPPASRHRESSRTRRTSLPSSHVYTPSPRGHGAVSPISSDSTLCGDPLHRKRSSSKHRDQSTHHTSSSSKHRDHKESHSSSKHQHQHRHSTPTTPSRRTSHGYSSSTTHASSFDPRAKPSSGGTAASTNSKRLAPLARFNPFSRRARADSLSAVVQPPAKARRVSVDHTAPSTRVPVVAAKYFSPFSRR